MLDHEVVPVTFVCTFLAGALALVALLLVTAVWPVLLPVAAVFAGYVPVLAWRRTRLFVRARLV